MAYTVAQLQAIEEAIASGELTVEYEGKKVTYRSMAELMQASALIRGELEASGLLPSAPRRSYVAHSKG